MMKERPERYIKKDNLRGVKKSIQIEEDRDLVKKLKFIDNDIFNYPILCETFYDQANPDDILFEGELMKYMPGFKYQYFKKYCLLSKEEFKYYKNEISSLKHVFPI